MEERRSGSEGLVCFDELLITQASSRGRKGGAKSGAELPMTRTEVVASKVSQFNIGRHKRLSESLDSLKI